jgi:alpha-tubulin N-acetyltransferase 1
MRRPLPAKPTLADEDVPELLGLPDGISRWTGDRIGELRQKVRTGGIDPGMENLDKRLCRTIDILGARSQRAQEINVALTSVARLCENKSFRLYLLTKDHRGVGILKMGVKKLFVTHPVTRSLVEVDPLCVLDFYVDESCQRHGCGKALYAHMLQEERVRRPETLAIDRPSPKMLGFMKKHYGLSAFAPQVNNFVVFDRFFDRTSVTERGKLIRAASPVSCERNATPSAKNEKPG